MSTIEDDKATTADYFFGFLLIAGAILAVVLIVMVPVLLFKGHGVTNRQEGYCDALNGRYELIDYPHAICVKGDRIVKEWK